MQIKQHTPEWHQAKLGKIGGSEIFGIALYYCPKELKAIGIDSQTEQSFQTPLELYLKVKYQAKQDSITRVNADFGIGMEDYVVERTKSDTGLECIKSDDFVSSSNIHSLAVCSPDGIVSSRNPFNVKDFDGTVDINQDWGNGMLELKTTPYDFNFEADSGTKWQYIFQLQYNMLLCGNKWGMLSCLTPKEKEYDSDFLKGKVLGQVELLFGGLNGSLGFDMIDRHYNLYTYIYPQLDPIQQICVLALNRLQEALDANDGAGLLPNKSIDNKAKLLREKKMLAQIYPERFGSVEADADIDGLLNERYDTNVELLRIQTAREALDHDIITLMKDNIEIIGSYQKVKFDKRGFIRFSKNRTK